MKNWLDFQYACPLINMYVYIYPLPSLIRQDPVLRDGRGRKLQGQPPRLDRDRTQARPPAFYSDRKGRPFWRLLHSWLHRPLLRLPLCFHDRIRRSPWWGEGHRPSVGGGHHCPLGGRLRSSQNGLAGLLRLRHILQDLHIKYFCKIKYVIYFQ